MALDSNILEKSSVDFPAVILDLGNERQKRRRKILTREEFAKLSIYEKATYLFADS